VVEPAELTCPFDREQVDRLLDDADDGVIPPGVAADRADRVFGEVAALVAEADASFDFLDRGRESECFVFGTLEQVERKPMCRSRSHARQPRELRYQVVNSGAQHGRIVPTGSGLPRGGAFLSV
jgi:hypothetical protein